MANKKNKKPAAKVSDESQHSGAVNPHDPDFVNDGSSGAANPHGEVEQEETKDEE